MHDTHLIENILKYFQAQENAESREIKKARVCISEFGSLNKEHFLEHYKQAVRGTKWESLELEVSTIPFGAELEITGLEFGGNR